ncbi:hypothetical protein D805_0484 [Bifidobacterium thermophilum RBL67]|uniref:Uncharacterized protein n=1 Tax=Bifidobacterium thermophilum RBL67 TaxID=1254439 RepID=M4RBA4_9BIFI|nr:hypothetical protein D805_0484 [Bifidobacterium thermophilum RBL67]
MITGRAVQHHQAVQTTHPKTLRPLLCERILTQRHPTKPNQPPDTTPTVKV